MAQSVRAPVYSKLDVVGSSPTVGKKFFIL